MDPRLSDADRRLRAAARKSWPVRKFRLGEEPVENLFRTTTAAQRLTMLQELSDRAWELSGAPWPDYPRSQTPLSKRRLGSPNEGDSGP